MSLLFSSAQPDFRSAYIPGDMKLVFVEDTHLLPLSFTTRLTSHVEIYLATLLLGK